MTTTQQAAGEALAASARGLTKTYGHGGTITVAGTDLAALDDDALTTSARQS